MTTHPAPEGAAARAGAAPSPMMAQYTEIKAANPDCLLFYRMGDFYELFFEDAVVASRVLGITLTKRGKHQGDDIPMCGVPIHAADGYLQRLIRQGHRVAVCEQIEDPAEARKRGAKSVVRRKVTRLVTPGTLTEDTLLDSGRNNFLTALHGRTDAAGTRFALASIDISTGEFLVADVAGHDIGGELQRIAPSEVLVADGWSDGGTLLRGIGAGGAAVVTIPAAHFDGPSGERLLKQSLGVGDLGAFGTFSRGELAAIGALLTYVHLTQVGERPLLQHPLRTGERGRLVIDAATRANLELVRSNRGGREGTLLAAIDRTVTSAGARELAARLGSPLADAEAIRARLDAVAFLTEDADLRQALRKTLRGSPDSARALARLALGRGGPRDLGGVRGGLETARGAAGLLQRSKAGLGLPATLSRIVGRLSDACPGFEDLLAGALADELPPQKRDGGFVRAGHSAGLDAQRALRDDSRHVIAGLQAAYAARSGVRSLKVRHNNVLGYFLEVTAAQSPAMEAASLDGFFRHRQTLAGVMRYATDELSALESRITTAADRALALELEIFAALCESALAATGALHGIASALAELDCLAALAELAEEQSYVRPEIDDALAFVVEGGRHPVVEQARIGAGGFVDNDCRLASGGPEGDQRLMVLTGPNMAGKSTFLRQNALIVALAQMGSFVPARSARIGVVDRLFSRVGAADDLAAGRSTFMVEMVETAAILNQATERSFVILDEIGRGTATFDGLAIAWGTLEHLHDQIRARALFATHYHELTEVAKGLSRACNATVEVREWKDEIVFLYRVVPGAADRSYGLHVARLAGLPRSVVARARAVLAGLEASRHGTTGAAPIRDLPLFAPRAEPAILEPSRVEAMLDALSPDALTPREALDTLYRLKALLAEKRRPGVIRRAGPRR